MAPKLSKPDAIERVVHRVRLERLVTTVVVLVVLAQGHTDERGRRRDGNGEKTRASVVAMCSVASSSRSRSRSRSRRADDDEASDGTTTEASMGRRATSSPIASASASIETRGEDDIESAAL